MVVLVGMAGLAVASCGSDKSEFSGTRAGSQEGGPFVGDDASLSDEVGQIDVGQIVVINGDDGASTGGACTPKTCADWGYTCGKNGDGCGGVIDCGSCTAAGEFCGGGGYSKCGATSSPLLDAGGQGDANATPCTPKSCSNLGLDCGWALDGCGTPQQCGASCPGTQYCGANAPNKCGGSVFVGADGGPVSLCQPATCQTLGYDCGPASDGCGQLIPSCGTCGGADSCGGGGQPGKCAHPCTGLCAYQQSCDGGMPTTVTGRILAGQSAWTNLPPDPVPNVLVYISNGTVKDFVPGAACRQCGDDVSGEPLVSAYTNFDGTFTLTNVPVPPAGAQVPLVIQMGRWRRQVMFPAPQACSTTAIGDFNLPRNHGEGQIPLTAISTGNVDALECVLLKMGVDQAEFTTNSGGGRIHIYAEGPNTYVIKPINAGDSGVGPGAYIADPNSQQNPPAAISLPESALLGAGGSFMNYDQIMLPCWGRPVPKTNAELANLITYGDAGGHFFATHYSYSWLVGNAEFNTVAQWHPDADNPGLGPWTLNVSQTAPPSPPAAHGGTFVKWLNLVQALSNWNANAVPNPAQVSITNPRYDADGVANGSIPWIDGKDQNQKKPKFLGSSLVEHFTFDTPVAAGPKCGHAIFSDFHVTGVMRTNVIAFPNECDKAFSPQEKILEYMIWDLASCVGPPRISCQPQSCADQHLSCGPAGDGCGSQIANGCGICTNGQTCGGGGVRGQCGAPDGGACTPLSCADQNVACGPAGDGCGGLIASCGTCAPPQTCGGGGVPGQCGGGRVCTPYTCAALGFNCGPAGDGCGALLDCGPCTSPSTCGGGGVAGQCGAQGPPK
jgi:hypothetical protein